MDIKFNFQKTCLISPHIVFAFDTPTKATCNAQFQAVVVQGALSEGTKNWTKNIYIILWNGK